ncbi:reverse transcriptase domain-containing protein [Tanacetum coccineum]
MLSSETVVDNQGNSRHLPQSAFVTNSYNSMTNVIALNNSIPRHISESTNTDQNGSNVPTSVYRTQRQQLRMTQYADSEDATYTCAHCQAKSWYGERTVRRSSTTNSRFSTCCSEGKVVLPFLFHHPPLLTELMDYNGGERSKLFRKKLKLLNSMFSFTLTGGNINREINDGHGPYAFKINGHNHHRIGTLLPTTDEGPRMAKDRFVQSSIQPVTLCLIGTRQHTGRQYNLPTASEVVALIPGDVIYIIEFQKRRLPHCHSIIFLHEHDKISSTDEINHVISVELPSEVDDPIAFNVETNNGRKVQVGRQNIMLDNRFVVPHNIDLIVKYDGHINVEWCNQGTLVKYLFSYLNKGPDRATVVIEGDDVEWVQAIRNASQWKLGDQLREMFVTILLFCRVSDHNSFFKDVYQYISEDVVRKQRRLLHNQNVVFTDQEVQNYTLLELEDILNVNNKSLVDFLELPQLDYTLYGGLNPQQRDVYDNIMQAVNERNGGLFFVYGCGGTGKMYLWKTIISWIRSLGRIVLAVASSGIASLLFPDEIMQFHNWLIAMGDGRLPCIALDGEDDATWITIPEDLLSR